MNAFFQPIIVDELVRTQWRNVGHLIPSGTSSSLSSSTVGAGGGGAMPPHSYNMAVATPSPQVSAGVTQTTNGGVVGSSQVYHPAALTAPPANSASALAAANAAAAVALSDIASVPPPTIPIYYKYANHLAEGMCLVLTDTSLANGYGGAAAADATSSTSASSGTATAAYTNNTISYSPQSNQHSTAAGTAATGGHASSSSPHCAADPSRPVRAWVAQLKPEAMITQLQGTFSHVKVGIPQLMRLVEASLKSGLVAVQLVPQQQQQQQHQQQMHSNSAASSSSCPPPPLLRVYLPISLAATKGHDVTLSLSVDAFSLEEVVDDRARPSCYSDFVLSMVVQPMLKTQAALCAALTVLAQQGRLGMDEFEQVFRHPIVSQNASVATISSVPTFWTIVTEAALPRPVVVAPPPPPAAPVAAAYPPPHVAAAMGSSSSHHDSQSHNNNYHHQSSLLANNHHPAGGATAGALGVKRVSSYVESAEERDRKRALIEQLNRGNNNHHNHADRVMGGVGAVAAAPPLPTSTAVSAAAPPLSTIAAYPLASPQVPHQQPQGRNLAPGGGATGSVGANPYVTAAIAAAKAGAVTPPAYPPVPYTSAAVGGPNTAFSAAAAAAAAVPPPTSPPPPPATATQNNAAQMKKIRKAMM